MKKRKWKLYGESINTHHGNISFALMSQAEVAKKLGISQNRVSQLERTGLAKLKLALTKGTH